MTVDHNGRPVTTDVLIHGLKVSARASGQIIVLPGNPSVLPFYEQFSSQIADRLDHVCVHTVGHAGFGFDDHNDGAKFDLEDQIAIKILYIERLLAESTTPIVLIGHSVGAFMAMEIMKRRPDLPIDNAAFLFPALCELDVAWPIHILKYPIFYEPLALLISYLPDRWKSMVAAMIPKIRHETAMISQHCNAHTVRNGFALVKHELEMIRDLDPTNINLLNGFGDRLLFVFTRFDAYVPMTLARRIQSLIPDAVHVFYDDEFDVQHAFVLKDSARVASTTLDYLARYWKSLSCPPPDSS